MSKRFHGGRECINFAFSRSSVFFLHYTTFAVACCSIVLKRNNQEIVHIIAKSYLILFYCNNCGLIRNVYKSNMYKSNKIAID